MVLLVWSLRALVFFHGRKEEILISSLVIKVKGGGICLNFDSDTKIKDGLVGGVLVVNLLQKLGKGKLIGLQWTIKTTIKDSSFSLYMMSNDT